MSKTPVFTNPDIHGIVVLPLGGPLFVGDDTQKVGTIEISPGTLVNRSYFFCYELAISVGRDGGVLVCDHGMDIDPGEAVSCLFSYTLADTNAPQIVTAHILPEGEYDPVSLLIDPLATYRFKILDQAGHVTVNKRQTSTSKGVGGSKIQLFTFSDPVLVLVAKGLIAHTAPTRRGDRLG